MDLLNLHPLELSTHIAQRIYSDPDNNWHEANLVEPLARRFYARHGMTEHNPLKANYLIARAVLRATVSPILYEIESGMHDYVERVVRQNGSLPATGPHVPQLDQDHLDFIDSVYAKYGTFDTAERDFLQESAAYSYGAFLRFVEQAETKGTRQRALWGIFRSDWQEGHNDIIKYLRTRGTQLFYPPSEKYPYIATIVIGGNITALNILKPAGEHAHLWPQTFASTAWGPIRANIDELAKPQNMTRAAIEAAFSQQVAGAEPPEYCPFAHSNAALKEVWDHPLLLADSLDEQWCFANVPFIRQDRYHLGPDTAARKRLEATSYIADRTLWPDTVSAGVGIVGALSLKYGT